jgi:hypothetical protein
VRVWLLGCTCALAVGACLLPKYSVVEDGGSSGAAGTSAGGRGGNAGGATGAAGVTGGGGRGGAAGSVGAAGGAGGVTGGVAGSGPGTGGGTAGTGGSSAGRGGTTGTAGTGGGQGGLSGRGGTTGTAGTGGAAGRGGTTGTAGTGGGAAGRGGTTGAAGSSAGRGGSSAGTGGSSVGGSTVAPSWLNDISVVYQFDTNTPVGEIGVEAHGIGSLHLEQQGTNIPQLSSMAGIEGGAVSLIGTLQYPSYLQTPPGAGLPGFFQTAPSNSWTTGGWFHITATNNQQWLIHDEGPTNFQQGGFFFYVDQQMGKLSAGTAFAYCRAGVSYNEVNPGNSNMKEVETPENNLVGNLGFDANVPGNWVHLTCRYNANTSELSILVGGVKRAGVVDTMHQVASGPGPFMIGCNEAGYCALQGDVDEVFFETSALPDYDVLRIYACGIDGSRCRCNGALYVNCGFLQGSCGLLPACNTSTP